MTQCFNLLNSSFSLSSCTETCLVLSPTDKSPVDAMSNKQLTSPWHKASACCLNASLAKVIFSSRKIGTNDAFENVLTFSPGLYVNRDVLDRTCPRKVKEDL